MQRFKRSIVSFLIIAFIGTSFNVPTLKAGELIMPVLPKPGAMIALTPAFTPAHLQGLTIHQDNPFNFDFIIQKGDAALSQEQKTQEYGKLVKYFLASLTVPEKDQWVNLSPYENSRIIENSFGKTEMGRDLLGQDYLLKQITSSLMYPESGLGKVFWDKVYARAYKEFGNTNIPVNTFNKVWIVPDQADVYESGNSVYILRSHLKVMLEEDYLAAQRNLRAGDAEAKSLSARRPDMAENGRGAAAAGPAHENVTAQIIRQIILPAIEKEVNERKNFALLRQIYSGMILATWYKKALKESLLGKIYADKAKVKGVGYLSSPNVSIGDPQSIYQQYLQAFKKGVYNYIKEEEDKYTKQIIPRKYFAGGFDPATKVVLRQYNQSSQLPIELNPAQLGNNLDRAQIRLDQYVDAAMSNRLGKDEKDLLKNPDVYKALLSFLKEHPDILNEKIVVPKETGRKDQQQAVYHRQDQMQQRLGEMYRSPPELLGFFEEHGVGSDQIRSIVHARIDADPTLSDPKKQSLKARIDADINSNKHKQLTSLFALLTAWNMRLRSKNPDGHIIYLARDAGFLHLMEGVTNPNANSSVYHLSRARMSGVGGESGGMVYVRMQELIKEAMGKSGGAYQLFQDQLQDVFNAEYQINPEFRVAVDFVGQEMASLGYGQNGQQDLVIVDTGFLGTIPYFIRSTMMLHAQQTHSTPVNVEVALIAPSSIAQFAQELFGYDNTAFSAKELGALWQLDAKAGTRDPGAELENVSVHPIRFNETDRRIEETSAEDQAYFYYEKAVAVAAALEFMNKLSEAPSDEEMAEVVKRELISNFDKFINSQKKYKPYLSEILITKIKNLDTDNLNSFDPQFNIESLKLKKLYQGLKMREFNIKSNLNYVVNNKNPYEEGAKLNELNPEIWDKIKVYEELSTNKWPAWIWKLWAKLLMKDPAQISADDLAMNAALINFIGLQGEYRDSMTLIDSKGIQGGSPDGTSHKRYKDRVGNIWFFKSPPAARLHRVLVERIASRLAERIGLRKDEAFVGRMNGKLGIFTKWQANNGSLWDNLRTGKLTDLTRDQLITIVREHALDWLISNHDSHGGSFLKGTDGSLKVIDKGQSYKYFGDADEKLSTEYNPNAPNNGANNIAYFPIYNLVWKALSDGEFSGILSLEEAKEHVLDVVSKIEAISDEEFEGKMGLKEYAAIRFDEKVDQEAFLRKAKDRKIRIRDDFNAFFQGLRPSSEIILNGRVKVNVTNGQIKLLGQEPIVPLQVKQMWVLRHGRTPGNNAQWQGWANDPIKNGLSEQGRQEAQQGAVELVDALAKQLSPGEKVVLVISPLIRAAQSGQYVIEELERRGIPYELTPESINDGAKERNYGDWNGKTFGDLTTEERDKADRYYKFSDNNVTPNNGESNVDLLKRVEPWLKNINQVYQGRTVVVVGHARQLSAVGFLLGYKLDRMLGADGVVNLQRMTLSHSKPLSLNIDQAQIAGPVSFQSFLDTFPKWNLKTVKRGVYTSVALAMAGASVWAGHVVASYDLPNFDTAGNIFVIDWGIVLTYCINQIMKLNDKPIKKKTIRISNTKMEFDRARLIYRDFVRIWTGPDFGFNKDRKEALRIIVREFQKEEPKIPKSVVERLKGTSLVTYDKDGGYESRGEGISVVHKDNFLLPADVQLMIIKSFSGFMLVDPLTGKENYRKSRLWDPTMLEDVGGIDLNAANLNMNIKKDGRGVPLPLSQQDLAQLSQIDGFAPQIIDIQSIKSLPILNELKAKLSANSL